MKVKVIRLKKGDRVIETLTGAISREGKCGTLFGIGAVSEATIKVYNLAQKSYSQKTVRGNLEVCNLTGVVAKLEDKIAIHPHITLTNENFETFGGHLEEAVVSATLEVIFVEGDSISRKYSEEIGLNLLDI